LEYWDCIPVNVYGNNNTDAINSVLEVTQNKLKDYFLPLD